MSKTTQVPPILARGRPLILSIDPGLNGTGVAVWRFDDWTLPVAPVMVSNLYCREGDWITRAVGLTYLLAYLVKECEVSRYVIELPEYQPSARGMASLGKGDILKTVALVGMFLLQAKQHGIECVTVNPSEWKGQLPKGIVETRLRNAVPGIEAFDPKSHSWDAIGIGWHAKGFKL